MKIYLIVTGGTLVVISLAIALICLIKPAPRPPGIVWDARFLAAADDYGVRFRNAPQETPIYTLPQITLREVPDTTSGSSGAKQTSRFEITGVPPTRSENKFIPGAPEAPADCTRPIVFSDGSEARLKMLIGVETGKDCGCSTRFLWAMTPDGNPATLKEAKAAGWEYHERSGSWPNKPYEVLALFELKGTAHLTDSRLVDAMSGAANATASVTHGHSEKSVLLEMPITRWTPGERELILIARSGPMKTQSLPCMPESEIDHDGLSVRHLGVYPVHCGSGSGSSGFSGKRELSFVGETLRNVHFVQFPPETTSDEWEVSGPSGEKLSTMVYESAGLRGFYGESEKEYKTLTISRYSEVRRIRMHLPDFPVAMAPGGTEDPLDWKIPAQWDRSKIDIRSAAELIANLNISNGGFDYTKSQQKLSAFPGKNTLREVLVVVLENELREGRSVKIDCARREMIVEAPEPSWRDKIRSKFPRISRVMGI